MAVRDRSAAEILAGFALRLGNTPEAERAEAVRQIGRILLLRLHDRFGTSGPGTKQGQGGSILPGPHLYFRRPAPRRAAGARPGQKAKVGLGACVQREGNTFSFPNLAFDARQSSRDTPRAGCAARCSSSNAFTRSGTWSAA